MKTLQLNNSIVRTYKNNGQHAEQVARYTLTGEIVKADNKPHTAAADILDIQIKSAKATVCEGTDLQKYLDIDKAKQFGYVTADFKRMYLMSRAEWVEFVNNFSYVDHNSKHPEQKKIRLKNESKKMLEWLDRNI